MRRRLRRFWILLLSAAAVTIILLAAAVGAFRLLVSLAPDYRQQLSQQVSDAIGRKVDIGRMDLTWRRLHPSLDLHDVTVFGDDGVTPVLKLEELAAGIDVTAALSGRVDLAELRLVGPVITVERLADGTFTLRGIDDAEPLSVEDLRSVARLIERVGRLVIEEGQVVYLDAARSGQAQRLRDVSLLFLSRGERHSLEAHVVLPGETGGELRVTANSRGQLQAVEKLETDAKLAASGLKPGAWLAPYLVEGVTLAGEEIEVELASKWSGWRLKSARGQLAVDELRIVRTSAAQPVWQNFELHFDVREAAENRWRVDIERLEITNDTPAAAPTTGFVELHRPGPGAFAVTGSLNQLRFDDWPALLGALAVPGAEAVASLSPAGNARDLSFHFQRTPDATDAWQLRCQLQGASVAAAGARPGLRGVNATLSATQDGGELVMAVRDGELHAPELFERAMPLRKLDGTVGWKLGEDGWVVSSDRIDWHGPGDIAGYGRLKVSGKGDASPMLDVDFAFAGSDMNAARQFIPKVPGVLDESVREWLRTSIVRGRVTRGDLKLRGSAADFPYHNGAGGTFDLRMNLVNGMLVYAPGWPGVTVDSARLRFNGRTMKITEGTGNVLGTPISGVEAVIPDFEKPLLQVRGQAAGQAPAMLTFLTKSPLRDEYANLVRALQLEGPARLDLTLNIPLNRLEQTQVEGIVSLDGNTQLRHARLPESVTGLTGQVRFNRNGLHAQDVQAAFMGMPLTIALAPEEQAGVKYTHLTVGAQLELPRDSARLSKRMPAEWLSRLTGGSHWLGDMLLDADAAPSKFRLQSDLQGLAVQMPPPFGKTPEAVKPITIVVDPSEAAMRADVNYGNQAKAALRLIADGDSYRLDRGALVFGEAQAVLPTERVMTIDGKLAELDLDVWRGFEADDTKSDAKPAGAPVPMKVALQIGTLRVWKQSFENVRMLLGQSGDHSLLTLYSERVQGEARWPLKPGIRRTYDANFERILLAALPEQQPDPKAAGQPAPAAPKEPPIDPAQLPGLRLRCKQFQLGEVNFGAVNLEAVPLPDGLKLQSLATLGGDTAVQAAGEWRRPQGQSSGRLKAHGTSSNIRRLFTAFGYTPSLQAETAEAEFDVHWLPHADGLEPQAMNGTVHIELKKGSLLAVKPGYGRVLGLMNFYALPRRLTLDFRDVVSEGLVFDELEGGYKIENGNAFTRDLEMRGPVARMEIKGRVGIAARDYDQVVKLQVQSQVSTGVALAGTALGGPAVGAILLLTQQLFKKPLGELAEITYHLRGTWDNPDVDRVQEDNGND